MKKFRIYNLALLFTILLTFSACQINKNPSDPATGELITTEEDQTTSSDIPTPVYDWIKSEKDIDITEMNVVWQNGNLQFMPDENAVLSLYVKADIDENGIPLFDDGQDWALLLETKLGTYPIFTRQRVQLGDVSCAVFNDSDGVFHIVVTVTQTADYLVYECVFDAEENAFERIPIYDNSNINFIVSSK